VEDVVMPKYLVTRCKMLWEEATVEAEDEEAAIDKAYEKGFLPVESDTRDITVEEL